MVFMINEKDFICLLRKFIRKIQFNELWISAFEFNEKRQQLQVKIVILVIYYEFQVEILGQLGANVLVKQNLLYLLLTFRDIKNCCEYILLNINTVFTFLSALFWLEQAK